MSTKHEYWRQRARKVSMAKKLGVHWKDPLVVEALAEKIITKVNQLPDIIKAETINTLIGIPTLNLQNGKLTEESIQQITAHLTKVKKQKKAWLQLKLKEIQNKKKDTVESMAEIENINLPDICPMLGVPLIYKLYSNGKADGCQASLDRIDSTKGYVKGNVQIISLRANILKRDATLEELAALGIWAARQLWGGAPESEEGEFPDPE
jgi:hypothetical protein